MKKLPIAAALLTAFTFPAYACWNAFEACADEPLPMSEDTFMVNAKGGRFILADGPNAAVLSSAAQGCYQRGYPQFIITQAQGGSQHYAPHGFTAWNNGYGTTFGNTVGGGSVGTTSAVIKCVKKGGTPVSRYLQAQ